MRKTLAALALLLGLAPAAAQQPNFTFLPPNTVVGRLGVSSGPAQAIPFATLGPLLGNQVTGPGTTTVGHFATWANTVGTQLADTAAVSLTTQVSGTLPVANGGTNATSLGTANNLLYNNAGAVGGANVWRTGANQLDLSNSATAQQLRVYNTTDNNGGAPTNSEWGGFDWTTNANILTIGTQASGTGNGRDVRILTSSGSIGLASTGGGLGPLLQPSTGFLTVVFNGAGTVLLKNTGSTDRGVFAQNSAFLGFMGNGFGSTATSGLSEVVAGGPIAFGNPGTGQGDHTVYMQWGGQSRVSSDQTYTSTTVTTNVMTVNVAAGRTYSFDACVFWTTGASAGGIKIGLSGTATVTNLIADGYAIDGTTILAGTQVSALNTNIVAVVNTGTTPKVLIKGTITVNAAGTLTIATAQNTSNATSSVVKRGSYMWVHDMP